MIKIILLLVAVTVAANAERIYTEGPPCQFPFDFNGKTYTDSCAFNPSTGFNVCPVYGNGKDDSQFRICMPPTGDIVRTVGGNACVFPFKHQGQTYIGCKPDGTGHTECAVDGHGTMEQCVYSEPIITEGYPCKFPFYFRENEYTSCTLDVATDNNPWCAIIYAEYDRKHQWANCLMTNGLGINASAPEISNTGIYTYGPQCIFPFTYEGTEHIDCIPSWEDGSRGWCAIQADKVINTVHNPQEWGFCVPLKGDVETDDGDKCIFPFKYEGEWYDACLPYYHGKSWCAVNDADYDSAGDWGYCKLPEITYTVGAECEMPSDPSGDVCDAEGTCAIYHADVARYKMKGRCIDPELLA